MALSLACVALAGDAVAEHVPSAPYMSRTQPAATEAVPTRAVVSVVRAALGAADPDAKGRLAIRKTIFAPDDVIAVSIETLTSDEADVIGTLHATWTYDNRGETLLVRDDHRSLVFRGPGTTMFSIRKPDGFPPGEYRVEIALDGVVVVRLLFSVRR